MMMTSQALGCALIRDLHRVGEVTACKEHVAKVLESMQRSPVYGAQVRRRLAELTAVRAPQHEKNQHHAGGSNGPGKRDGGQLR